MKKVFQKPGQVTCAFTDKGVAFTSPVSEAYYPYGSIDTIHMSLLGVFQVTHLSKVCTFAVSRADRAAVKEAMKLAREAMKDAPRAEPLLVDLKNQPASLHVDASLPAAEQLKQYKALFVQGAISKELFDWKKLLLKD